MPLMKVMPDVFISYSRRDKAFVEGLDWCPGAGRKPLYPWTAGRAAPWV